MKALVVALALVCMVGVAHASPNDVIQACVRKDTGVMRISGIGGCRRIEYPLQWNQQGPAGQDGQGSTVALNVISDSLIPDVEVDNPISTKTVTCPQGVVIAASAWVGLGWDETYPLRTQISGDHATLDWARWTGFTDMNEVGWDVTCGVF